MRLINFLETYNDFNFDIPSTTTSSSNVDAGVLAVLGAFLGIVIIIALAVSIVVLVAQWKMFKKGNQPGWAALIPFYNQYVQCKMVGVNPWWILIVIIASFINFIPIVGSLLSLAASIYFMILLNVSTARAFGKEDSFAIGLILLPVVFYPILGFGKAEYKGSDNPMNDFVFKKAQDVVENGTNANKKFCTSCGAKVSETTKFCPTCGKEIK